MTTKAKFRTVTNNPLQGIMIEIFGSRDLLLKYSDEIMDAIEFYVRERRAGLKTQAKISEIQKVIRLCDELSNLIQSNKNWIIANSEINTSPVPGVEEILENDEYSPLNEFRSLVATALDSAPTHNGREQVHYRRRLWIWLAIIYEEALERRAATSKNRDGIISGNFVRYILALSTALRSLGDITPDMVDQFIDWYRSPLSTQDREEVHDVREMKKALRTGG